MSRPLLPMGILTPSRMDRIACSMGSVPWGTYEVSCGRNDTEFPLTTTLTVQAGGIHVVLIDVSRIPMRRDGGLRSPSLRLTDRDDTVFVDAGDLFPLTADERLLVRATTIPPERDGRPNQEILAMQTFRDALIPLEAFLRTIPEASRPADRKVRILVERWTTTRRPEFDARLRTMFNTEGDLRILDVEIPRSITVHPGL
jgi:hypothetical protein